MRDGYKFSHWGVPTQEKKDGMVYVEGIKTWITDFAQNPYAIEWLRCTNWFRRCRTSPTRLKT